ncbi:MAG: DUF3465 domain-containing protein [Chromatiales bacterium]|nr:DUF3465 domain-containing protein [Gammaproteobacteria bacterium]MCP5352859.1 DUF3465 domain-containing protein [Chromatiales bacterium]
MKGLQKLLIAVAVLIVAVLTGQESGLLNPAPGAGPGTTGTGTSVELRHDPLKHAFDNRLSDLQVEGSGTVSRVLSDDNTGSRHQRFILRMPSGLSVLVAHNIDLADRIPSLQVGDVVDFFGEYEWNEKGGVIHWTHHDPAGRHADGWLRHAGRTYE